MPISFQVLGKPGRDNSLVVRIDSGQAVTRLLFDCGDDCLSELSFSEIQSIDQLFFSHLHMDHIGGFDSFFRCTFNRETKPNVIWGPQGTASILQHRFQGFWWNLHAGQPGTWHVNDIHESHVESSRFEIAEAFACRHPAGKTVNAGVLIDQEEYSVSNIVLEHGGPCIGYVVREKPKSNVDTAALKALGLRPGPWVQVLKSDSAQSTVEIDERTHDVSKLRQELLVESQGQSIAYLTDFLLDDAAFNRLIPHLQACSTLVCESQYGDHDAELARRNKHTTISSVANLAARSGVESLVLFHLSDRYTVDEWGEMLTACRAIFPATSFPEHWDFDASESA